MKTFLILLFILFSSSLALADEERLFKAVVNQNIDEVTGLLDAGADVNTQNEYKETPLHWAVKLNQPEIVRLLLERGADVNAQGGIAGATPLHYTALNNHAQIAEIILEYKPDTTIRTSYQGFNFPGIELHLNKTALDWARASDSQHVITLFESHGIYE